MTQQNKKAGNAPQTVDDLKAAEYNPRQISAAARRALETSIEEFGDISGITFNTRTGRLVTGHQRVQALKDLYGAELTFDQSRGVITADGQEFSVRLVDWDEPTEKAANIAANSPHLSATFDDNMLASLLEDVQNTLPELAHELRLDELISEIEAAAEKLDKTEPEDSESDKQGDEYRKEGFASFTISGPEAAINEIKLAVTETRSALAEKAGTAPADVTLCEALHKLIKQARKHDKK